MRYFKKTRVHGRILDKDCVVLPLGTLAAVHGEDCLCYLPNGEKELFTGMDSSRWDRLDISEFMDCLLEWEKRNG